MNVCPSVRGVGGPSRWRRLLGAAGVLLLLGGALRDAAGSAYLFVTNAPGEVTVAGYAGWIQIDSFQHGMGKTATNNPSHLDVTISKSLDKSSPKLVELCNLGKPSFLAKIDFTETVNNQEVRYYSLSLSGVLITGYSLSSGGDRPTESVYLHYSRIDWQYVEADTKVNPAVNWFSYWDLTKNTGAVSNDVAVFRVQSLQVSPATTQLSWTSRAGKTYEIRAASTLNGPYVPILTVPSAGTGLTATNFARSPFNQFFRVVEQ